METLKGREIKKLLKSGNILKTKHLIVVFFRNSLGRPRFAFITSKKFSKKAVERNRAKRVMREALRLYGNLLKNTGCDVVLIPKKSVLGIKVWQLKDDITYIAEKLKKC
ncbi:ribonuclease P protein component [Persephonella atlantica]|uniref:Ribonuclease P protein component n=1 Tax=Persephonella atlantica TaxID=2699429 RepID=A0ABS1GKE4_9AQUI|nr:ribonuclease P protein component [Persephonella atlantica]MBK3333350.1 ribonuclease P protein component [Persephonella atlantica]